MMKVRATGVLDLRVFVFYKLLEDGTLVPKHVAAASNIKYVLCSVLF
jgi:hypothetical protein